ncbi:hypothetical protein SH1V18_31500 [Vallitalea longa]|uniref:Lipoprotein n=1 Tax=Vallitalea longa TaxID=2936439 RepID=A0A9W5YB14_9FIRM|nr:hypothetical protein [Vallitalea longa]GKX30670.1 hypothetical protein SH1V18_31500 [Vallitalea longa]
MRKILIAFVILMTILIGCDNSIKPIETIKTDFDISEAEKLMKRAWKPVNEMTNSNYETKPDILISSKEELYKIYDFTYMSDMMKYDILETIVETDENHEIAKDNNGYIDFKADSFIPYIPTIFDEGIYVKKAYLREEKYKEEYSYFDIVELVVEEDSNDEVNSYVSDFSRRNIFRKNEDGEWYLYVTDGTFSISWDRDRSM